jgi:hypothetical protein
LIGLTALFAAACGGSGKRVKLDLCDGGACSDAKRDTAPSSDTLPRQDVADASPTPDQPADLPREPVAQPDEAPPTDQQPPTLDTSTDTLLPDTRPDVPRADGRDTQDDVPLPTDDVVRRDTAVDQPVSEVPVRLDGGVDGSTPQLDTSLDTQEIDANTDDAPLDGTPDAPPVGLDGSTDVEGIDGGCAGVLCAGFEDEVMDAGVLPAGWTAAGGATYGWSVTTDGTDRVLVESVNSNTTAYLQTGSAMTDMTITLRVKLLEVDDTNANVRICGRFVSPFSNGDGYCLYIESASTGTTPGTLTLYERRGGVATELTGTNPAETLPITVGTWHTYKLVISGAGPVSISAYLDGATTPTVTGSDDTQVYTSGIFALGVLNATAEFDDIVITTP